LPRQRRRGQNARTDRRRRACAIDLTAAEVEAHGLVASEVGTFVVKVKDGTVVDRGKYVVVWKKVGGQWLLHRDIWNTSQPAPKP
jgi:ketosteroid isomerase-like protein